MTLTLKFYQLIEIKIKRGEKPTSRRGLTNFYLLDISETGETAMRFGRSLVDVIRNILYKFYKNLSIFILPRSYLNKSNYRKL